MKKIQFLILFVVSVLIYSSCKSEKSCNSCEGKYVYTNLYIQNQRVRFKDYNDRDGQRYLKPASNNNYVKPIEPSGYARTNYELVAEFYLIDGDQYQIDENATITSDMISGVMAYYLDTDDQLYATLTKHINGTYESTPVDMLKTKFISTNDIYATAQKFINISNCIILAYIQNTSNITSDFEDSELQFAAYKMVPECGLPCDSGPGTCDPVTKYCGWTIDLCEMKQADSIIRENGYTNYPFVNILMTSRAFRDNYMAKHKGSIQLIDFYYKASKNVAPRLDLDLALDTYHIMQDYLPKMVALMNDPYNNQQILLNNQDRDRIVSFLNEIDPYLSDNKLKSELQIIISLVNDVTNKTNNEITRLLDSPVFGN